MTIKRLIIAIIVIALLTGFGLWRISKARCYQLVGDVICKVETAEKIVALSFDDGPTPEGVDAVLAALEPRGVKATFFLIGNKMERYPGQARRLVEAGHELGNHSFTHVRMIGKSSDFYTAEIAQTDAMLKAEGQAVPTLFRPPFGKRLLGLPRAVEDAGYQTIMWNVEDEPEYYKDVDSYTQDILSKVKPGAIILMHPMYRTNQTARDALPMILDGLAKKGYRVVTVSELLAIQDKKQ